MLNEYSYTKYIIFFLSWDKNNSIGIKSYRKYRLIIHICHVFVCKFRNGIGRKRVNMSCDTTGQSDSEGKLMTLNGLTELWTYCQQTWETYNGLQCSRTGQGHVGCTKLVFESVLSVVRGNDNIISHQSEKFKQMMSKYSLSSSKFQWLIQ